jgi:multicomponent Na+:H+ antiporter subunit E
VEIIKANIDVAKRIMLPSMAVTPTMIRVTASQKSDLGLVIYANSITLTPGTISVDIANGEILVHALSREGAESLLDGEMDRRVTRMAGEDR